MHDSHSDTSDDVTDKEGGSVRPHPLNDGQSHKEEVQPTVSSQRRPVQEHAYIEINY